MQQEVISRHLRIMYSMHSSSMGEVPGASFTVADSKAKGWLPLQRVDLKEAGQADLQTECI